MIKLINTENGIMNKTTMLVSRFILILLFISTAFFMGCGTSSHPTSKLQFLAQLSALEKEMMVVLKVASESVDSTQRSHAYEAMGQLPWSPPNKAMIRKGLHDSNYAVKFAACVSAGDVHDSEARNVLVSLLKDKHQSIKMAAAYALEKIGDTTFEIWYDQILLSEDHKNVALACMLLGKLGNQGIRSNSQKKLYEVMQLNRKNYSIKLQAAEALANLGDKAISKRVLGFSNSQYTAYQLIAISALDKLLDVPGIKHADVHAQLALLSNDDQQIEVQLAAISALGKLADGGHIQQVRKNINYTHPENNLVATMRVRGLALMALGNVGARNDYNLLWHAFDSDNQYIRMAAARGAIDFIKRHRQQINFINGL